MALRLALNTAKGLPSCVRLHFLLLEKSSVTGISRHKHKSTGDRLPLLFATFSAAKRPTISRRSYCLSSCCPWAAASRSTACRYLGRAPAIAAAGSFLCFEDDVAQFPDQLSETVTRKKVAGMEVTSVLVLLLWLLNRTSSSWCRSPARPFFSAASKAFMVGP